MTEKGLSLSIIMPVHNIPEGLLRSGIESVLAQSHRDFELIAVNDASPDPSNAAVLAEYAARDPRIVLITHPENRGVSAARNTALAAARGRYLGYFDADDLIEPDYYERLLGVARRENADLVMCGFRRFSGDRRVLKVRAPHRIVAAADDDRARTRQFLELSYALWNKVFLRERFGHLRFRTELRTGVDVDYTFEAFLTARRSVSIAYCGYWYRLNEISITSLARSGRATIGKTLNIIPSLVAIRSRLELPERLGRVADYRIFWLFVRYANKFGRIRDEAERRELREKYRELYRGTLAELAAEHGVIYHCCGAIVRGDGAGWLLRLRVLALRGVLFFCRLGCR